MFFLFVFYKVYSLLFIKGIFESCFSTDLPLVLENKFVDTPIVL